MRASIKLLLWLFASASALIVVLVVLLLSVDVNLHKAKIEDHISAALGREVILESPLSLVLSLTPRIAANGLKIVNPDWASRPFLAVVDKLAISVNLLPLLSGDVEIISLELHGVDLRLEEATSGANNFTFSTSGELVDLPIIESISLYDLTITYSAAEGLLQLQNIERVTARKVPQQPVELGITATLNALPMTVSLRGQPPDDNNPSGPWQITVLGKAGDSDIGGHISIYQEQERPKMVASLNSEQIYLNKLIPVSQTDTTAGTPGLVIPNFTIPVAAMQIIDVELEFKGQQLHTAADDLGDIELHSTLEDGVFRIDSLDLRNRAEVLIESEIEIDTSQNPPVIEFQWIARQLGYGVLLEQLGFAETAEGELDITLDLSGGGHTLRDFLGNANGQLIIVGQEGRFGSRQLDLWGADLLTTMLSSEWRKEDVTELNCVVAHIDIENGMAKSDDLLIDTSRITIGAAGTLDLESEELDIIFAPQPKQTSLVSLASPVHVTGTIAEPEVESTVLPRNRVKKIGIGTLTGLINPAYLIFTFTQIGSGQDNPCAAAIESAMER